ncbi:TetR/AcrR family transcriptional regulator [Actinocorallia populi]|uniref:TetR/AcrR family transcriptional regulator n=1 Tax=Actinocorallia populi TaxID=2079200 RepID=UPI000D08D04F|nr:TetR/AcrR family transcriptional regulator [Actinocorallia populi]
MGRSGRREVILAEAMRVFSAKGYAATSLGDVAAAAGITRSSMYDYFPSKKALFLDVLKDQTEAAVAYVGPKVTSAGTGEARMRAAVAAYFDYALDHPAAWRLMFDRSREGDSEVQRLRWEARSASTEVIRRLLSPDFAHMGIDADTTAGPVIVELMVSALDGATRWWERHPETPVDDLVEAVLRMLLRGLRDTGELTPATGGPAPVR